MDERRRLA